MILMYHRIAGAWDPFGLSVPPDTFHVQMEWVRAHASPMSLAEYVDVRRDERVPSRAVVLTFDDGYLDNLTYAEPVLSALGLPATYFVTTATFNANRLYWWDALAAMVSGGSMPQAELSGVHARLRELDVADRDAALRALAGVAPLPPDSLARPMNAEEIRELAARPKVEIGAHTVNHLALPRQSIATQRHELMDCRRALESLIRRPVLSVSYPFGQATDETIRLVSDLGFQIGVGVEHEDADDHQLFLSRVDVAALRVPLDEYLMAGWVSAQER